MNNPSDDQKGEVLDLFCRRLNLHFNDRLLLHRALTHRSFLNENPEALEDNERLEFLGDAVLDFLVGAWIYNHFPEMAEGELTRIRSALVRTEKLAEFALLIDLGKVMRLGKGETLGGGNSRDGLLCATFEALVGAIYLDSGIEYVQKFIEPLLKNAVSKMILSHKEQDPKSTFQERVQALGKGTPVYRTVSAIGPDHAKLFEVEVWVGDTIFGRGQGHSKRIAAKNAAKAALDFLGMD